MAFRDVKIRIMPDSFEYSAISAKETSLCSASGRSPNGGKPPNPLLYKSITVEKID